jgi:hypothetical protein
MTATDLLRLLVTRLEARQIPYALGGSVASMVYGEPRATLDIDVVVTLDRSASERLLEAFPAPDFYLSPERVAAVVAEGGNFNAIHPESGLKVDFFVASDRVEQSQLARRLRRSVLPGLSGWFSPPEELIVKKLEYFRMGASSKHVRDIRSMLRISPEAIDLDRVEKLVRECGLEAEWMHVHQEE